MLTRRESPSTAVPEPHTTYHLDCLLSEEEAQGFLDLFPRSFITKSELIRTLHHQVYIREITLDYRIAPRLLEQIKRLYQGTHNWVPTLTIQHPARP